MAVTVTHATVTAVPDDPAYDIGSDEWNANHTVTNALDKTGDTMTGALAISLGTITTSNPAWNITQTWNDGSVTFTGLKMNVTATASASGSLLMDLRTDNVTKFWVRKDGVVSSSYILSINDNAGSGWLWVQLGTAQYHQNSGRIMWTDGGALEGTPDTGLARNAAGVVEVNSSSAGTLRDLKARNVITPGVTVANLAGAAQGARSFVTDATQTLTAGIGAVVAGGGANAVPVVYDGTNWRIG